MDTGFYSGHWGEFPLWGWSSWGAWKHNNSTPLVIKPCIEVQKIIPEWIKLGFEGSCCTTQLASPCWGLLNWQSKFCSAGSGDSIPCHRTPSGVWVCQVCRGSWTRLCPRCCGSSQQKEQEMLLHLLSRPEMGTILNVLFMNLVIYWSAVGLLHVFLLLLHRGFRESSNTVPTQSGQGDFEVSILKSSLFHSKDNVPACLVCPCASNPAAEIQHFWAQCSSDLSCCHPP